MQSGGYGETVALRSERVPHTTMRPLAKKAREGVAVAVFDERWSIHGSTNLNCRSLEDDKDFELVVLVDDAPFAQWILEHVRDVDIGHSRRIGDADVHGTIAALQRPVRDPRTLAMLGRRVL